MIATVVILDVDVDAISFFLYFPALVIRLTTRQVVAMFRALSGLCNRSQYPPPMMRQNGRLS